MIFARSVSRWLLVFSLLVAVRSARAEDWSTYRHDNYRSGTTSEAVEAAHLEQAWVLRTALPPQSAWPGPAKWDAYRSKMGLSAMRAYDQVFHPIIVGDAVYYGSSADDSVHCLDATSGQERWVFITGGPVRIAPTWYEEKIYFGSDDGYAYCLDAATGELVWKFAPGPQGTPALNDGRLISYYPIRTGVTVSEGTAYFAASFLPWLESYLCALDAQTGQPVGEGRYALRVDDATFEGAPAVTDRYLVAPQGRAWMRLYALDSGENVSGVVGGGTFVVIAPQERILAGPISRNTSVFESDISESDGVVASPPHIATHEGATSMVVTSDSAYLVTGNALTAIDAESREKRWRFEDQQCFTCIVGGDTVYLGELDSVRAFRASDGELLWQATVDGEAQGLALANGTLCVSTNEGVIYGFRATANEPFTAAEQPASQAAAEEPSGEELAEITLPHGPYVQFTAPGTATVRWHSDAPCASVLVVERDGVRQTLRTEEKVTQHEMVVSGLRRNREYPYHVEVEGPARRAVTKTNLIETFFDYNLPALDAARSPWDQESQARWGAKAEEILARSGISQGICLLVGSQPQLGWELALRSDLRVILLETDPQRVGAARELLLQAGANGGRVAVREVDSFEVMQLPGEFANLLVVSQDRLSGINEGAMAVELARLVRAEGGVVMLETSGEEAAAAADSPAEEFASAGLQIPAQEVAADDWTVGVRTAPLPGAGTWSHQYGGSHNGAYGGEDLAGISNTEDMELQWIGRPGPRYQADRQVRKPAPLSVGGRLFMQGLDRLITLDAFNGSILWSLEIPELRRFNMPRDSANWCADENNLFLAYRDECWRIDAQTGEVTALFDVVQAPGREWDFDWSYISQDGDLVFGSSTKAGSSFHEFWGGGYWFDGQGGWDTAKVCSDNLFALDKESGQERWNYSEGVIINTTITVGGDRVYFVESREESVIASESRVIGDAGLWEKQYLVALDEASGERLWERPLSVSPGIVMFSLAYSDDRLVLVSSASGTFHVHTYDAATGEPGWKTPIGWWGSGHGGHMSRPTIVGDRLYVRPAVLDIETGKALQVLPGGGCGTYCATTHAVLYRSGNVTMFSPDSGETSSWSRLRPDCWLSTIPASGMVLSPEGGGGCWCGSWFETSAAFAPGRNRPRFATTMRAFVGSMSLDLESLGQRGEIRYTLDGSQPTGDSPRYEEPLELTETTTVTAALLVGDTLLGPPLEATFTAHEGREPLDIEPEPGGLICSYYEGEFADFPDFDAITPAIEEVTTEIGIGAAEREDNFALRFTGYFTVPRDGVYEFMLSSDDGSRLMIGDEMVVDHGGIHPAVMKSGSAALRAGVHSITIEFFEATGQEALVVEVQGPGISRQSLPAEALGH